MSNSLRSGASDFGILVNGVERVTVGDGGITLGAGRRLAQIVTFQTGAVATGTTTIPLDNTIPQNTEGTQFMTLDITPTDVNSTLEITVVTNAANSAFNNIITALFQDTTANALAAVEHLNSLAGGRVNSHIEHIMLAGTTSLTTFKVRIGGTSAGTTTFNGGSGVQSFGGVMASRITIKEYLP